MVYQLTAVIAAKVNVRNNGLIVIPPFVNVLFACEQKSQLNKDKFSLSKKGGATCAGILFICGGEVKTFYIQAVVLYVKYLSSMLLDLFFRRVFFIKSCFFQSDQEVLPPDYDRDVMGRFFKV